MRYKYIMFGLSLFCIGVGFYLIFKSDYFTDGFTGFDSLRYFFSGTGLMLLSMIIMLFAKCYSLAEKVRALEGGKDE